MNVTASSATRRKTTNWNHRHLLTTLPAARKTGKNATWASFLNKPKPVMFYWWPKFQGWHDPPCRYWKYRKKRPEKKLPYISQNPT